MRSKIPRSLIAYAALIFYICTPLLDSAVCADCVGNVPFPAAATLSPMETLHADVSYSRKDCPQANDPTEQGHRSSCSICSNSALDTEPYSPQVHVLVSNCDCIPIEQPLSELHYSIHKPPPNFFV